MKSWRQDAARTRQQDAGAPAAGGSVQGLGYQSPSRLVRLCQTVFYKKIFNHGFRIGGTDKHGWMDLWMPGWVGADALVAASGNSRAGRPRSEVKVGQTAGRFKVFIFQWQRSGIRERPVAGESGVAATALPPQSKTRGLQASPWNNPCGQSTYWKSNQVIPGQSPSGRVPVKPNQG
jgi:hypothetical protein